MKICKLGMNHLSKPKHISVTRLLEEGSKSLSSITNTMVIRKYPQSFIFAYEGSIKKHLSSEVEMP